jgi:hypothetical protein
MAFLYVSPYTGLVMIAILTISLLLLRAVTTSVDPREPPAIKPKPLIIGHLLGLIRYHAMYFKML